jgi:hypothetical protein
MSNNIIFSPATLTPEDLLLDPNNPRLVNNFEPQKKVADEDLLKAQGLLLRRFSEKVGAGDDFTDISELYESMKTVGFSDVDRIVVREIKGINKYLVIEGNRRTAAVKRLLENSVEFELNELVTFKSIKNTFKEISCVVLQTKGLSDEEIENRISVILGLRHFGSIKEWGPISSAYNAYSNYMNIAPKMETFSTDGERTVKVARKLGKKPAHVKRLLQAYILYIQLTEVNSHVKKEHFSLIEASIVLATKYKYFRQNETTLKFDETSLVKLQTLCQFEIREQIRAKHERRDKLIMPEPRFFARLDKLIKVKKEHLNEAIRDRANDLMDLVESADVDENGTLKMTVDRAASLLTSEINRKEWVSTLAKHLTRRFNELPIEDYDKDGNHLLAKERLLDTQAYKWAVKLLS